MKGANRPTSLRGWFLLACGCAGLLWSGCAPSDPLDLVVQAETAADYNHWRYRNGSRLGAEIEREFLDLEKERFLGLQVEDAGTSPDELRARLRAAIHGHTVREVLTEGYLLRRRRLLADDKGDTYLLDVNHALIVHPQVEEDLAAYRARTMEKIMERQSERRKQIASIEARLRELHPDGAIDAQLAPPSQPHVGPKREKGATF